MVFCGSGGMATVPPVDGGTEAAAGGAGVYWLASGLAAGGVGAPVVVVFLAFLVVVEDAALVEDAVLEADALAFFRHELRADALFWLWQEVDEGFALVVGGAGTVGSFWANEGMANDTAPRAARAAIKRRMKKSLPGRSRKGTVRPQFKGKIVRCSGYLCQIVNLSSELQGGAVMRAIPAISVEQRSAAVLISTAFSVIAVSALLVWLHVA
jgi:hypothetical protein